MGLLGNLGGMLKDVKGQYLDKALGTSQKPENAAPVVHNDINMQENKSVAPMASEVQNAAVQSQQAPAVSAPSVDEQNVQNEVQPKEEMSEIPPLDEQVLDKIEDEPEATNQPLSSAMTPMNPVSALTPRPAAQPSQAAVSSSSQPVSPSVSSNPTPNPAPSLATPKPEVTASKVEEKPAESVKVETAQEIECVKLGKINSVVFSDVYVTPDKKTYIWGGKTNAGLIEVEFEDFPEFLKAIEEAYEGTRSYLLQYLGRNYRVERSIATEGPQFCARKMPTHVPNLKDLGLPQGVYNHLLSLAGGSGLILLAGATGSGKSTTIAALLKEYLSQKGGYAFTIEDPVELPLDGVYVTPNKEIGLCKQTVPPEGKWEEGIKSALRSKPRYIYLGEIRSPDIASEALRAATSGHLVLSSIHANNVNEAVNSLVKYAASSGISESMAYELVAGGLLGIVHQILTGAPKRAQVTTIFANPDVNAACQVRGMIRSGKLNMATLMEQQRILLQSNKPLFNKI